jgi:flagellar biosynthesis protein FlhF
MRLKSYFSGTVEAAMSLARREMGEEAMLIHSRPASPEARHLGAYEVVFGVYGEAGEGAAAESPRESREARPLASKSSGESPTAAPQAESLPQQDWLSQQVARLRQEVERMAESLTRQSSPELKSKEEVELVASRSQQPTEAQPVASRGNSELTARERLGPSASRNGSKALAPVQEQTLPVQDRILEDARYRLLVEQELAPSLAREAAMGKRLEDAFEAHATLGRDGARTVIVALIGPPGSGKTTTLAKLAARYGLQARKRTHILSADVLRIGASDQMRTLASLLGIGFGVAETPLELDRMIEEQYTKDLILIDTPGLGKADAEDARDLAQMIGSDPEIDTHLVLPASMKQEDLARQVEQFRLFRPRKLIFSRMDETSRYGNLVSLAAATGLAVSFLANGQRIPDDLEAATKERLVELLTSPWDAGASIDLHGDVHGDVQGRPALGHGAAA